MAKKGFQVLSPIETLFPPESSSDSRVERSVLLLFLLFAVECVRVAIFPFLQLANWFIEEMGSTKKEEKLVVKKKTK